MKSLSKVIVFLAFLCLMSSCGKEISHIEYEGKWGVPIGTTNFNVKDMLANVLDSTTMNINEDSTSTINVEYITDKSSVNFFQLQDQILDFDTVFNFYRSKSFPDIPGTGTYDFYYRDTILFNISDFVHDLDVNVLTMDIMEGEVINNVILELPEGWDWSCVVFSDNINNEEGRFTRDLNSEYSGSSFPLGGYSIQPTNGKEIIFVCDFTLTIAGPCPAGTLEVDLALGMKNIRVDYLEGYLNGVEYSMTKESNFNIFSSLPDVDLQVLGTQLAVNLQSNFGMAMDVKIDYLVASNDKGEVIDLTDPNFVLHLAAPENINEFVTNKIVFEIPPDFFSIKPSKIDCKVTVTAADDQKLDYLSGDSELNFFVNVDMPMQINLKNLNLSDTLEFDGLGLSEDDDFSMIEDCQIIVNIDNTIPLDLGLSLIFKDENYNTIDTIFGSSMDILSPDIDQYGDVVSPFEGEYIWSVDSQKITAINDARFVFLNVGVQTPSDDFVRIKSSAGLEVSLRAILNFTDINLKDN